MDNKTKKIVFVIVASIISLISTVVGIVFGVPQDAIKDAVDIDTGIVETTYGVHVMYFDSFGKIYRDALVENALRSADYNVWYDATAGDGSYTTSAFGMKYTTK